MICHVFRDRVPFYGMCPVLYGMERKIPERGPGVKEYETSLPSDERREACEVAARRRSGKLVV
jgi:hypothetical protein